MLRILNWSEGSGHSTLTGGQNAADRFLDYIAATSPRPFIDVITHNGGLTLPSTTWIRNGMVVGGADDKATNSAADDTLFLGEQPLNPAGTYGDDGWEMPHIVAPAVNISTAGATANTATVATGTSVAGPQIAALAADMLELNLSLLGHPATVFAGLMVGANHNVDAAQCTGGTCGRWPLNLSDGFDDYDGAGLVNAYASIFALASSAKMNGGNTSAYAGHDYGQMCSSSTPNFNYYSEVYTAKVDASQTLRVCTRLEAKPTCSSGSSNHLDCTADSVYPVYFLYVFDGSTQVAVSGSIFNNYQFTSVKNTTASTKNYTIKVYMYVWPTGMTCTDWGLAWLQGSAI